MRHAVLSAAMLTLALASVAATSETQTDLEGELRQAQSLYQEARFSEAIVRLEALTPRLTAAPETTRKPQLSEAHLLLALCYLALDDRTSAKSHFVQLLRLDPTRRLDPDVYAPKVIALLEQAAQEASPPTSSQSKRDSKRGSKALPIVLGVSGAAGAAVALAATGKASGSQATSSAAPSPSPSPPIELTGPSDIVLLGIEPAPGSQLQYGAGILLRARVRVVHNTSGEVYLHSFAINPLMPQLAWAACVGGATARFQLQAGEAREMQIIVGGGDGSYCPSLPFTTTEYRVYLQENGRTLIGPRIFAASYTWVR